MSGEGPSSDAPVLPDPSGAGQAAGPDRDPALLGAILANLSSEIRRPLSLLRGGIGKILASPADSITDLERSQAETMLSLCDDLDRLTRDCLGSPAPGRK